MAGIPGSEFNVLSFNLPAIDQAPLTTNNEEPRTNF